MSRTKRRRISQGRGRSCPDPLRRLPLNRCNLRFIDMRGDSTQGALSEQSSSEVTASADDVPLQASGKSDSSWKMSNPTPAAPGPTDADETLGIPHGGGGHPRRASSRRTVGSQESSTQEPPPTDGLLRNPAPLGARSSVAHDPREADLDTPSSQQHVQAARIRTPLPSGPRLWGHDGRRLSVNERQGPHEVISISTLQMQDRAQAPGHKECLNQGSHPTARISPPTATTALPQRVPKPADADPTLGQRSDARICRFNCVFDFAGCKATFAKKNEWKRHVTTQHLLLNYWRCAEGACAAAESPSHNPTHIAPPNGSIFNRKDLFTQHLKRMHATKKIKVLLNATSAKTTNSSKKPSSHKPQPTPATAALLANWDLRVRAIQSTAKYLRCALPNHMSCPVPRCAEPDFRGAGAWDQRMEHVARHMVHLSKGGSSAAAAEKVVFGGTSDKKLVDWASQPDVAIIEHGEDGGWVLKTPLKRLPGGSVVVTTPVQHDRRGCNVADTNEAAASAEQQKPKKIKIITSYHQAAGDRPSTAKKPKVVLNSPTPAAAHEDGSLSSGLEYDGYTSTDSISDDRLHPNDWRLHQVKTRTFATNPNVAQYWHWVTEEKKKDDKVIEHQVLESVEPTKWAIFKKPYNFHLKLGDIQKVSFARDSTRVMVTHKKGRDGKDMNPRGDVMAQFKRERTKRRLLTSLREKGVKIAEVGKDFIEGKWDALDPETLPGSDSD